MSTVTASRPRGKTPVARFARVSADFLRNFIGTLTLTVGGKVDHYTVERLNDDDAREVYRLTKHVGRPADETPCYAVYLSEVGHSCTCPGYHHHDHCKHVDSLVALRHAGRI
jgi:hypothetical protein